ncbi:MAG: hypothetical protein NBV68_16755, partial [Erythrobacter sp.]|uniref:hypothetical protein n=1 Tax=Erythrobacter sp. TaxID=1042 RepID=UPI0025D20058
MAKVTELPMSGAAPLGSDELVMVQNGEVVRVSLFALSGYLANPVAPPVFTEGPVIITDGTPAVGEEITFDLGTIVGGVVAGADLLRGSAVIVEDVGESYMLAAADEGEQLRVRVRASGPGGNVEAISAPIGPIGEAPSGVLITGTRLAIMGDSRTDNGMISQAGTGTGRTTGVPGSSRLQSIPDWMLRALDYPAEIVGQWTLGGNKSSQNYHDHALRVIAARNPDVVFLLDSTNDPIDYTGTGGLGPIPRGSTNPLLAAYQPRVGDREPVGAGIGIQGTTFGNIDKAIRFWGDGVANGLGRSVPVILVAVPSGQPSRQVLNRLVYEWAQEAKALGIYSNLIAPAVYPLMLVDPDMVNGPVASEVIRSDLKGDGSQGADGETLFLHPAPAEAQFLGEAIAADPQVAAAFAGRPSIQVLPTGANDSAFLNTNPGCLVGSGGGSLGYVGSSSPTPTGLVAPGWSLGHG